MLQKDRVASFMPSIRSVSQAYSTAGGKLKRYAYLVADYVEGGKRKRKYFTSQTKAEKWAASFAKLRAAAGEDVLRLTERQIQDARRAFDLLAERGSKIPDLVSAVLLALPNAPKTPEGAGRPLKEAVDEYLAAAEADGLREASMKDLRGRLGRFKDSFPAATIIEAAAPDTVAKWLASLTAPDGTAYSPLTLKHFRTVLHGLFAWFMDRGWIRENPAKASASRRGKRSIIEATAPGVLTPAQAEKLLRTAERSAPELVPAIVVGLFCGLRSAEIERIQWEAVSFDAGILTVGVRVAKKRSIRTVELRENARAWLEAHRQPGGPLVPRGVKFVEAFRNLRRAARLLKTWPFNAMRHSFASYHLAAFENAAATALQLGHRELNMLFNHYRGLVTKAEAAQFWAIQPETHAKEIRIGDAAAS